MRQTQPSPRPSPTPTVAEESCGGMFLSEAKEIASQSECVEEGNLKDEAFCNDSTGTWWLDLDIDRPGCAPACEVDVSTGEAEINWWCTELVPSEDTEEEYVCPEPGVLDCMPGGWRPELKYCTSEYSAWIEQNCPDVSIVW